MNTLEVQTHGRCVSISRKTTESSGFPSLLCMAIVLTLLRFSPRRGMRAFTLIKGVFRSPTLS